MLGGDESSAVDVAIGFEKVLHGILDGSLDGSCFCVDAGRGALLYCQVLLRFDSGWCFRFGWLASWKIRICSWWLRIFSLIWAAVGAGVGWTRGPGLVVGWV